MKREEQIIIYVESVPSQVFLYKYMKKGQRNHNLRPVCSLSSVPLQIQQRFVPELLHEKDVNFVCVELIIIAMS